MGRACCWPDVLQRIVPLNRSRAQPEKGMGFTGGAMESQGCRSGSHPSRSSHSTLVMCCMREQGLEVTQQARSPAAAPPRWLIVKRLVAQTHSRRLGCSPLAGFQQTPQRAGPSAGSRAAQSSEGTIALSPHAQPASQTPASVSRRAPHAATGDLYLAVK